jgi:acyl dehydratase
MVLKFAYEDFEVGQTIDLGSRVVSAEEIVEFASEFDPQPFHLDAQAGRASLLGGLAASGWHSCAMLMRLLCDGLLLRSTSQGAPGIDQLRWRQPVLAGDTLVGTTTVLAKRLSQKRPSIGLVTCRHALTNQHGDTVLEMENSVMFTRRGAP